MSDPIEAADRAPLDELFEQALAMPATSRESFLRDACGGDTALRAELSSLLHSHDKAAGFLDRMGDHVLGLALDAIEGEGLPIGGVVGRYAIDRVLAAGAMGVVFRAYDQELHRPVALKFLPLHQTGDAAARARLRSEARAASALDHPNIAVVYEIGTLASADDDPTDGRLFIAMPFYDGETLREKIRRGPLPLREAVEYAMQLADGLSSAHEAGIVHRDIKPGNLMVTSRGQLKILDFGVARWQGMVDGPRPQNARSGTVSYMSPEQTGGATPDPRTDLWSAGVVMYEMLTGRRPFRGESEGGVIQSILHDDPPSPAALNPEVPPDLGRIVSRCLAKQPTRRYPTAAALLADLRAVAHEVGEGVQPSVVVLPFVNFSPDPENEYFSDGLTEEVIGDLARIQALRVISRTSAMRLKGSAKDVRTIARELGVGYVLEGGVRRSGDSLRITVRFIDGQNDRLLWAHKFDGRIADVFAIQEQVARSVVEALRIRLSPGESRGLSEKPLTDVRAYECYLHARYEAWRFSRAGLERAKRSIEAGLALVGDNELLYSTLGHILAMYLEAGIDPAAATVEAVEEIAEKVFALNPESSRGHWLQAFAAMHRGDLRGAIRAGDNALAREPENADTLLLLGYVHGHAGRMGDAHAMIERATVIDPLTPLTQCMPGFLAILEGRFDDAVEPYRRVAEMDPESPFAAVCYGWSLAYARRFAEAGSVLGDAAERFEGTAFASWAASLSRGIRGESAAALKAITPAFEAAGQGSEMFARELAHCYALAGANERALDWLERQVELGMVNYRFLAEHDWFLSTLRHEVRYRRLMETVRTVCTELGGVP